MVTRAVLWTLVGCGRAVPNDNPYKRLPTLRNSADPEEESHRKSPLFLVLGSTQVIQVIRFPLEHDDSLPACKIFEGENEKLRAPGNLVPTLAFNVGIHACIFGRNDQGCLPINQIMVEAR